MQRTYTNNYRLFIFSGFFIVSLIVFIGMATYTRNMDWRSEKTLWEDVLSKYPNSTRAMHNLAHGYYEKQGNTDAALMLYQLILSRDWQDESAEFRKGLSLNNMATIYYYKGLDEAALDLWNQALTIHPRLGSAKIGKTRALIGLGRWDDAMQVIDESLSSRQSSVALNLKAFILFKKGRYAEAIPYLQSALKLDPLNRNSMIYLSAVYSRLKHYKKSRFFLTFTKAIHTADARVLLMLLENATLLNDHAAKQNCLNQIIKPEIKESVLKALRSSRRNDGIPLMLGKIIPLIASQAEYNTSKWVHSIEALIDDASH
jgi:tetratricopeptide (TPR) repeat protein